jgi:hypothetical protein
MNEPDNQSLRLVSDRQFEFPKLCFLSARVQQDDNRDSQIYPLCRELIVHVNVFERRSSDKCQTGLFVLTVTMNQQSVDCFKSAARSLGLIPRDGST